MIDIYVERLMYFLWTTLPLDAVPGEVIFSVLLTAAAGILFAAFVSLVTLWDKTQKLLNA
jgi:hypothetical protein